MKVRFLGHSCVEIIGKYHILIDPDFTSDPLPGVDYICITHAHKDHIGRIAEVPGGMVLASPDVCEIAATLGVPRERLCPVKMEAQVANIKVLPGFSATNGLVYTIFVLLIKHHKPDPAGTPLSFLIEDDVSILHIGDAYQVPLDINPDILCLPWRSSPFRPKPYKEMLIQMVKQLNPRYIMPVHYDLPKMNADPNELIDLVEPTVLKEKAWYEFHGKALVV